MCLDIYVVVSNPIGIAVNHNSPFPKFLFFCASPSLPQVLVPMVSIHWRGADEDLVNSWMGNNTQSQYLEISCLVQNVRSLHGEEFSIM